MDNDAVVDGILSAELRSLDATPSNTAQRQWVRRQDIVDEENDGHLALRIGADGQATGAKKLSILRTVALFPLQYALRMTSASLCTRRRHRTDKIQGKLLHKRFEFLSCTHITILPRQFPAKPLLGSGTFAEFRQVSSSSCNSAKVPEPSPR